jgi:hypothetical protein
MSLVMDVTDKLDDLGKPAWIALMVLGFIICWPVGLALLAFLIWSGRMGCRHHHCGSEMRERWRHFRDYMHESRRRGTSRFGGGYSGNTAFEEYKAETLQRLEEEQKEFMEFLYRLRHAKDKAEFDQFMDERWNRPTATPKSEGEAQSS